MAPAPPAPRRGAERAVPGPAPDRAGDPAGTGEELAGLDALQTDELCPCNWNKGEATLDPKKLMAGA